MQEKLHTAKKGFFCFVTWWIRQAILQAIYEKNNPRVNLSPLLSIEKVDNNYCAYIAGLDSITTSGKTIAGIKNNIGEAVSLYIETCTLV